MAKGEDLLKVMIGFKDFSDLPSIHDAINVMQIHIQKPKGPFARNYYSFKSKFYNMQLQVVIDSKKKFQDAFVGMSGSMNNAWILCISTLY
jgi:type II secretory pathway component PulK